MAGRCGAGRRPPALAQREHVVRAVVACGRPLQGLHRLVRLVAKRAHQAKQALSRQMAHSRPDDHTHCDQRELGAGQAVFLEQLLQNGEYGLIMDLLINYLNLLNIILN